MDQQKMNSNKKEVGQKSGSDILNVYFALKKLTLCSHISAAAPASTPSTTEQAPVVENENLPQQPSAPPLQRPPTKLQNNQEKDLTYFRQNLTRHSDP